LLERGPKFEEQGVKVLFDCPPPESIKTLYDKKKNAPNVTNKPKGTFIPGPIKDVNRAIAKIYRAYAGDVRRITDIVRCSVVLDTMEDINNFLMMLEAVGWVEQNEFSDAKQRARQGQNPLNFGQWSVIDWRQKLQLLIFFVWSYFKLYFLGLPQHTERSTRSDPALGIDARRGAFQIVRVKNRFAEESPVGGYRDVNIKVRIGFKCSSMLSSPIFVPVEHWDNVGVQTLVCEIQVKCNNGQLLMRPYLKF
jgi:hypothetical protein